MNDRGQDERGGRRDRAKLDSLRRDLQVGLDQLARGEAVDGPVAIAAIRRKLKGWLAEGDGPTEP